MAARRRSVSWSEVARRDLDEAVEFLAADSQSAAFELLQTVLAAADSLGDFSERGRVVPEVDNPAVRELLPGSFRLIYTVIKDQVEILAVLHQRRDFQTWDRSI